MSDPVLLKKVARIFSEHRDLYMLALRSGAELRPRNDGPVKETPQLALALAAIDDLKRRDSCESLTSKCQLKTSIRNSANPISNSSAEQSDIAFGLVIRARLQQKHQTCEDQG
jgi:hypothetical protein